VLPDTGDIVWAVLDPVLGTEQGGRRPVLILSDRTYHERSTRAVVCPITGTARDWPFDVPLPQGLKTVGFVLVDQIRTLHRASRFKEYIEPAPDPLLAEVRGRLRALLGLAEEAP
jgi:mRNA interferase MazF